MLRRKGENYYYLLKEDLKKNGHIGFTHLICIFFYKTAFRSETQFLSFYVIIDKKYRKQKYEDKIVPDMGVYWLFKEYTLMRNMIYKFYLFGLIFIIILALGLFFLFSYFSSIHTKNTELLITQSRDLVASEINNSLMSKEQVIHDAANYISIEKWDREELAAYFMNLISDNALFSSIYFCSVDNYMINHCGWQPPPNYDFRNRPWYLKAVNEQKLIFTEIYVNAVRDSLIITIAKPVYNSNNQLIGVVAGDVSIKDIISIIDNKRIKGNGYSFLIDGKGNVLAHPSYSYQTETQFKNITEVSAEINNLFIDNKQGKKKIVLDGIEGYLAYQLIEDTDWKIGSFIPLDEYTNVKKHFLKIFIVSLLASQSVFIILFWLQRKYFIEPIYLLDEDVRKINIEKNITYRVPLNEKDPFIVLRRSINTTLKKAHEFFSQLEKEKEKLKVSLERNSAIVNAMPDLLFVINDEGYFVDYQGNNESLLYVGKKDFIGRRIADVMSKEIAEIGYEKIQAALVTNKLQSFEYELDMPQGKLNFELRMVKSKDDEVIAIARDITKRKHLELKLDYLSFHDQLTGLYNRRFFEEELKRLDVKENYPLTLVMADVNGLKLINDSFGHKKGDELLKKTAEVIKKGCRSNDIVSRMGGDEFLVLLTCTDSAETEKLVNRIKSLCEKEKVASINLSISFGWETKFHEDEDISQILKKAEDYMYTKKLFEGPSMRSKTIETIISTLHEKNKREEGHSKRVSLLCRHMGEILGLSDGDVKELESVGLLHDIGKIAIDEAILNKVDKMHEEEWNEIKRHPEIGYRILNTLPDMAEMAKLILYHHEKWDGTGYPKGLKGEEIPYKARIIAIVDAYDAMVSDRAYRKPLSEEKVIQEFRNSAGTQFDPELVKIFVQKVLDKEW